MSEPEVVKTNTTGIDLSDAGLPKASPFGDDDEEDQAAAPEVEAPPPMPSPEVMKQHQIAGEDRVVRRQLIMTIQRYYSSTRFGPHLRKSELVEELGGKTIAEMQQLLSDIKFTVQNKTTSDMIQCGVPQMICAMEPLVCTYYDVKGLSNVLVHSETFKDILEELALESQVFSNTPASTRLMYEVAKTAFFVHEANAAARARIVPDKPVKVSAETSDLLSS